MIREIELDVWTGEERRNEKIASEAGRDDIENNKRIQFKRIQDK